jgi:hypothetical protein
VAARKAAREARGAAQVERRRVASAVRLLPAPFVALVVKDVKVLRRDLRNLSQLITPIILGVVYTFSLVGGARRGPVSSGFEHQIVAYASWGTALFVSWMFAMRLALGGIGMEGKRYWLLKVAPLRPEVLLASKFTVAYVPSLALGSVFLAATTVVGRLPPSTLPYNWIALAATIAVLCAVYLAFGTVGANLKWEDPRQVTRGTISCIGWIVGTAIVVIIAGVFMGIPILLDWVNVPIVLEQVLGLSVGLVLCSVVMVTAFWWATGRVAGVGES